MRVAPDWELTSLCLGGISDICCLLQPWDQPPRTDVMTVTPLTESSLRLLRRQVMPSLALHEL